MGQINEGVGIVDIKGDTPTFSEMQECKKQQKFDSKNIVKEKLRTKQKTF